MDKYNENYKEEYVIGEEQKRTIIDYNPNTKICKINIDSDMNNGN